MGRRRRARADHWVCELGRGIGNRVQDRGTGVRHRLQDLYDRRTCDPVRDCHELGAWIGVLCYDIVWGQLTGENGVVIAQNKQVARSRVRKGARIFKVKTDKRDG